MTASVGIAVLRRRELREPLDDRHARRMLADGTWVRVAPGAFVMGADWRQLSPVAQHCLRVQEVMAQVRAPALVSHFPAAAVWGIDVLGAWPTRVEVTVDRATGGRSGGAITRRALGRDGRMSVPFGRHQITTPAQTALDIARLLPFLRAVTAIDQALWTGRAGGALTTAAEIEALLDDKRPVRGDARARRALASSAPLSANVRETHVRLLVAALGFPPTRLQERRVLRSGRLVYGDLYFPVRTRSAARCAGSRASEPPTPTARNASTTSSPPTGCAAPSRGPIPAIRCCADRARAADIGIRSSNQRSASRFRPREREWMPRAVTS